MSKEHTAAARRVLQPQIAVNPLNVEVAGMHQYMLEGWPADTSADAVIHTVAHPLQGSASKAWHVLPLRRLSAGALCSWIIKADSEPCMSRIVLHNGSGCLCRSYAASTG